MGRHRSRSRSREKHRHREERDDRHRSSEKHSRRHEDSHQHRHRSRSPAAAGGSPPTLRHRDDGGDRRHRSTERQRHDDRRAGRNSRRDGDSGGSRHRDADADRGDALPPPPPQPHGRQPEAANGAAPSPDAKLNSEKRRSRFEEPEEPAHPSEALKEPPVGAEEEAEPEPNFGLSGKLAAESNKVNGVVLVYQAPAEAANPRQRWRLYQFKGGKPFQDPLPIHRQSVYLFGRERRVADIPTDHPSCSKQHAVLQFRRTEKEGADGMMVEGVRPYIMDLGSVNGTFVNNERIEAERYYELLEQDMLKFGNSTREYVLLHENSNLAG